MNQIALPLDIASPDDDEGYLVSECNSSVHSQLQRWPEWPHGTAILIGEQSSGKTVMAEQFRRDADGLILDDADTEEEEAIFHLWNRANEQHRPLLLTSRLSVSEWNVDLPDLKSRLAASLLLVIGPPDEAMMDGLLQKYFTRRGLSVSPEVIGYLIKRMERSYRAVELLAQKMDKIAIERKKPINITVAKAALFE